MVMELAELLEHEGLDPDELMDWAHRRSAALVAELGGGDEDPLAALLEPGTAPVQGGRRRKPSSPQPLSAAELPPPPEQPRLADGEPEPILETFNTGPIDLDSPEAAALIAETSTRDPALEQAESAESADESGGDDELEEIEFDDLVEIDEDELELLEEVDDSEPPPPPPPSSGPPALDAEPEIRASDTATDLPTPAIEDRDQTEPGEAPVQTGDTAAHPIVDETPVQTGDTAAHPIVDAAEPSPANDDFDLDFDED